MALSIDTLLFATKDIADICHIQNPAFIKLDTTGLDESARIIRISIMDKDGQILTDTLINPEEPLPEITPKLTGITDEMLTGMPTFKDVAQSVASITSERTLICWNAGFITMMLKAEFARAGWAAMFTTFDLQKFFYRFVQKGNGKLPALAASAKMIGVEDNPNASAPIAACYRIKAIYEALRSVVTFGLKDCGREDDIDG